jgi:hypothetical protein
MQTSVTRIFPRAAAPGLALLLASGAGCTTESSPVVITGFRSIVPMMGVCTPGFMPLSRGLRDSSMGTGYLAVLAIQSFLLTNELPDEGRTNTNVAMFDTAVLTYQTTDGSEFDAPPPTRVPINAVVLPAQELLTMVPVLPSRHGEDLANKSGTLVVTVKLTGELLDGGRIETPSIDFPIDVCNGCVTFCQTEQERPVFCSVDNIGQSDGFECFFQQ